MKFTTLVSTAILAAYTTAVDVACLVDDVPVAVVDLDTGICPFTLPEGTPVNYEFTSDEDYDVTFYFALVEATKYFTDIVNEGLTISIAANLLYGGPAVPYFQISDSQTPAANSTAALRRRLLGNTIYARDEQSDFLDAVKQQEGTEMPGSSFAVVDLDAVPSGGLGSGISTETDLKTTLVTVTSCSDNLCSKTEVPAVETLTTVTVDGEVTSYTTYCPITDVTSTHTDHTTVTITSCDNGKCTEVPAVETLTTETVEGVVTSYTTYCPITDESTSTETQHTTVTITACDNGKCSEVPAVETLTTETIEGVVTSYTTYCPVSDATATTESYNATSTQYVTSYITVTSCGPDGCKPKSMVETLTTVTVNGVETAYTTLCPVEDETSATPETAAPETTAPAVTTAAEETPATVAPVPVSSVVEVAPIPASPVNGTTAAADVDITTTLHETLTISTSAAGVPAAEESVSVVEGAASNVGAFTSVVALVFAALLL